MNYWKRDKEYISYLSDRSGNYLYPPSSIPGGGGAFFIESRFQLGIKDLTSVMVPPHRPFCLSTLPPYQKEGIHMVSRLGDVVYDIQGEGTYLSRRSRHPDVNWAPFATFGPVQVTRYTTTLDWSPGCHNHDFGAGVTVYSQEDHVHLVGPFRYYEHAREAIVVSDIVTTVEEVSRELIQCEVPLFAVIPVVIFPYKPGTVFQVEFRSVQLRNDFWARGGIVTDRLTLKFDRKFIYIDGALYSNRMMTKARMFEPDESASFSVPGFPRGKVKRVMTFRLGGTFFAALPNLPKRHALVFPLPTDLNYFFSEAMRNLVSWRVFTDDYRPVAEQKSLTMKHGLGDQVSILMEKHEVKSFTDSGLTVQQISAKNYGAGIDHHKLRVLFRHRKDHICWKTSDDPDQIEWIRVSNIKIVVPGDPSPDHVGGMLVGDLVNKCRIQESGIMRIPAPYSFLRNLISLLSANAIVTTYNLDGTEYELSYARLS